MYLIQRRTSRGLGGDERKELASRRNWGQVNGSKGVRVDAFRNPNTKDRKQLGSCASEILCHLISVAHGHLGFLAFLSMCHTHTYLGNQPVPIGAEGGEAA